MENILYNSRSELDKLPFGAVTEGTKVNFGIRVSATYELSEIRLILLCDRDSSISEQILKHVWTEQGYMRFE